MSQAEHEFWTENESYHDLARRYDEHIVLTTPTGHFECRINGLGGHCPFCATAVTYPEYRGPSL